jgi:hypothetical protein
MVKVVNTKRLATAGSRERKMTGCNESSITLPGNELDARVANLVPAVVSLLQRISSVEPTMSNEQGTDVRLTSELSFPDGIGEGTIVAELFTYRDDVRLDLHIEHDRVFAMADGNASDRRCYLTDYVASVVLDAEEEALPSEFVRKVVAGVTAARDAVRRHNRRANLPWTEIRVAAREAEPVS